MPQGFCGHRVGEIYNGEMCHRILTKLEVMGISIVDKPVQKYSVLFLSDEKTGKQRDHYNYALVQYAIGALREPFDGWDVERTSRHQPHSRYAAIGRNEPCPCESGKKYKKSRQRTSIPVRRGEPAPNGRGRAGVMRAAVSQSIGERDVAL